MYAPTLQLTLKTDKKPYSFAPNLTILKKGITSQAIIIILTYRSVETVVRSTNSAKLIFLSIYLEIAIVLY